MSPAKTVPGKMVNASPGLTKTVSVEPSARVRVRRSTRVVSGTCGLRYG